MRFTIILISIFYGVIETTYFGSHFLPSCHEEVICDGIGLLMLCIGLAVPAKIKERQVTSANK
jgi:hypothetical protein